MLIVACLSAHPGQRPSSTANLHMLQQQDCLELIAHSGSKEGSAVTAGCLRSALRR